MSAIEIKFDCPECSEGLAIDRRAIGHQVACPFCQEPITVPEVEVPPQSVPAPPAPAPPAPSLEALASERPEIPVVGKKGAVPGNPPGAANAVAPVKGGLPPRRKPGEKPKMLEGRPADEMPAPRMPMPMPPPGRRPAAPPPGYAPPPPPPAVERPPVAPPANDALGNLAPAGDAEVPDGYEQRTRRVRKRRNPDEHRLNPRERPKMVAFAEAVDENTFSKHAGHHKMPFWNKVGVIGAIVGILGGIGLGVLKTIELRRPDERATPRVLSPEEQEYEDAKARLEAFCEAKTVAEKMGFVRMPVTNIEGYPPLVDRMSGYYNQYSLRPHYQTLDQATATTITQGESEFLRIEMDSSGVDSQVFFEKGAAGYALDWDSFVGYNPKNWTEFLVNPDDKSESEVFRLIVTRTDHYSGMYQDQEKYRSYLVTDIHSSAYAVAYVVRDTPADTAIEGAFSKLLMRDKKRIQIIAKVNLVERGIDGTYLVQLENVLRNGWLLP